MDWTAGSWTANRAAKRTPWTRQLGAKSLAGQLESGQLVGRWTIGLGSWARKLGWAIDCDFL